MPKLPSGRHVALSPDRIMSMAREGNFTLTLALEADANGSFDILDLLDVVGFDPSDEDAPHPGRPVLLGLLAPDVLTDTCSWSEADKMAFSAWLDEPRTQAWLARIHGELVDLVSTVRPNLPDNLTGVLEAD